jgi:hypothetical protein
MVAFGHKRPRVGHDPNASFGPSKSKASSAVDKPRSGLAPRSCLIDLERKLAVRYKTIKVTMDIYGHLMSDGDNEAAQRIAELVFGAVLPKSGSKMVARGKNESAKSAPSC